MPSAGGGPPLLRIRVEVAALADDPIVRKLGLVDQLGLQLGESSRQIHARVTVYVKYRHTGFHWLWSAA